MSLHKVAFVTLVLFIINLTAVFAGIDEQGLVLYKMAFTENQPAGDVSMQSEVVGGPDFGMVDGVSSQLTKEIKKNSVGLSVAWNGIAGLGLLYSYRLSSNVAFDGGLGLSSMGFKYGIRGRYCFNRAKGSPFAGLGYMIGSGSPEAVDLPLEMSEGDTVHISYNLNAIHFIQLTGGYDYVANNGFNLIFTIGWAIPLNEGVENVLYEDGYTADEYRYIDEDAVDVFETVCNLLYKGGLVLSVVAGFSF